MVPLSYYLVLSAILFACGVAGFLIKRNIITIFMSIELMLNAVNLTFVAFAASLRALSGHVFVFVIMLLNAGEEEVLPHSSRVAVALGIPGLIVGLAIGVWVIARYAGLDRISLGGPTVSNGTESFGAPSLVAKLVFRDFLLPFEVTSVLILIAILGAVVLARREE